MDPMGNPTDPNSSQEEQKTCADADFNRGLEKGDTSFWKMFGLSKFKLVSPGYDDSTNALKVVNRTTFWSSVSNQIDPKCLEVGKSYLAQAKIKLERDGEPYDCSPGKYWGPADWKPITCPVLAIRARAGTKYYDTDVGKVYKWNSGEWNDIFGVFTVTDDMVKAETVEAWFTKFHEETDIIIDNLSIQPEAGFGCDANLIHNYDFKYYDTRSWEKYWSGTIDMWDYKDSEGNDRKAGTYSGFRQWHEGIGQNIDKTCIDLNSEYEVSVDVQIYEKDKTTVASCDPAKNHNRKINRGGCPWITVADQKRKTFPKYTPVAMLDKDAKWNTTGWNTLSGTFKFERAMLSSPRFWIQVNNAEPGQILIINKLVLKKKGVDITANDAESQATAAPGAPTPVPIPEVGEGECKRDVRVNVDAEIDPSMLLVVTNADKSVTAKIPSSFVSISDSLDTHWYVAKRFYSFSLAGGDWTGSYVLNGTNTIVSPPFAEIQIGDKPRCKGYMNSFTVPQTKDTCSEVIRNGDFEDTDDIFMVQWYHSGCGLNFTEGREGKALSTQGRTVTGHGLVQYLNTGCMKLGQGYDIFAKVQLVKTGSNETVSCNPSLRTLGSERCPRASIRSSKDGKPTSYSYGIANTLGPYKQDDWNFLFGSFEVTQDIADADQVAFYFDGVAEGVEIVIDDVSIKPSPIAEGGNILKNSYFDTGDTREWSCTGKSTCGLQMFQPGHLGEPDVPSYAVSTTKRDDPTWGIAQVTDKRDTNVGDLFELSAYIKLQDYTGNNVTCDPYVYYQGLPTFCPALILQHSKRNNDRLIVSSVAGPYNKDGWNLVTGYTTITNEMKKWPNIEVFLGLGGANRNIIADDITMKPTTAEAVKKPDCKQLVKNGDAEVGDARYWYIKGAGNFGTIETEAGGAEGGAKYFAHTGTRTRVNMGMWQELDKSCMTLNSKWKISSLFKYFDAAGTPVVCPNPGQMCPKWRVEVYNGSGAGLKGKILNNEKTLTGQWKANDWNDYEATFTMTQEFFDREKLFIYILAPENHVYHVDNIRVEPVA